MIDLGQSVLDQFGGSLRLGEALPTNRVCRHRPLGPDVTRGDGTRCSGWVSVGYILLLVRFDTDPFHRYASIGKTSLGRQEAQAAADQM